MSIGRMFTATIEEATLAAATDLFKITAPADHVIILHQIVVVTESDSADALVIQIMRATGGGTAAVTEVPLMLENPVSGVVDDLTDTTDTTPGAILWRESADVRAGVHWLPPPELRIVISPSGIVAVRSDIAITSTLANIVVAWEEIGGT